MTFILFILNNLIHHTIIFFLLVIVFITILIYNLIKMKGYLYEQN